MTAAFTPLRGKRVRWTTMFGLVLVPLIVAGLFIWGLWNPTKRLEDVTAAVVNLDEPVTVNGQIVPLGRVLAAELISGGESSPLGDSDATADGEKRTNFTWVLTNEEDAAAGIADGRFATSVTIPKGFSKAATSLSDGPKNAQTATIEVAESDRGRLLDTALSGIVTQTATRVLNQQLGEQFVGNVFVGMSTLSKGVGEAADGATKLADGGSQLADGTKQLADGTQQLADGTQQLAAGAGQLAGGAGQLSSGAGQLSSGAGQLASGATGLAGGARELATGARDAANGGAQLADGVAQYTGGVNSVLDQLISGSGQAVEPLTRVRAVVDLIPAEVFPADRSKESVLAQIDGLVAELQAAADGSNASQMVQLRNAGSQLAEGTRASANGQAELAAGLEGYAGGMDQYAAGVGTYAAGVGSYAAGVGEFTNGLGSFVGGVNQLAAQTPELASGAGQLADGAQASADGARALASGLDQAAQQIPNYTEAERKVMAQGGITPVKTEGGSNELFNAAGVPLFAGIALWAGALATFLVLSPLWSRTREAARGVFAITLRSAVPALLVGAVQGALAGIILPITLGYSFAQGAAFFGFATLAGVAFGLFIQGLSARFGGVGRFIAFVLLVIAFTVGIVSTVPGVLSAIGDASPIGAAFSGFQTIAFGTGSAGGAATLLVLWGLGGLALTGWAVARERRA